jgi:hypothetical protein
MKKQMKPMRVTARNEFPNCRAGMLKFRANEEPEIQQGLAKCAES